MRKIDKNQILATAYQLWITQFDENNQTHPNYSSSHKYYKDVLVSLLFCQQGLCAYTEILIAEKQRCSPDNFDETGRYIEREKQASSFSAQLDHFDSRLKEKYGWRWENFFAIQEFVGQYLLFSYLDQFVRQLRGFMYMEVNNGRGRMDLLILHGAKKYVVETKIWEGYKYYQAGKRQLAKYLGLEQIQQGYYIVFDHRIKPQARMEEEIIEGKTIISYCIPVQQEKPSNC